MKVHDEIETLTDVYLAGGLEADERRDVEEHAATCDACAAVLRDAKEFHGWVSGSSAPGAPPTGLEDRIIANLRAATPGARRWPKTPRLVKFLSGVAALFVFIVIGGMFTETDRESSIQYKLGAASGVEENTAVAWGQVPVTRGPQMDGYAGDTSADSDRMTGGLKSIGDELQRKLSALNSGGIRVEAAGVGGGSGGGFRGRMAGKDASLKNYAQDKAPATPAPMEEGKLADLRADGAYSEDSAGEMEKKEATRNQLDPEQDRQYQEQEQNRHLKIIRTADVHLEVEEHGKAYKAIGEIAKSKKGFVKDASTTKLANGKIRATVTLRVPPERFEETLADLAKLGTVRHQAISSADVTKQYLDLESRLKSKETLVERLKKVILEGRGTVKELMEVEVQMGATIEQIEVIKGELKYYNDLVGMSTITMQVFEKDMGLPFEYVQTLQSVIALTDFDADAAYTAAQKVILDAGGQVVESRMTRANADSASGFVRGKVDAEKFPAVREDLKKLGKRVDQDTVNQQQTGRGGQGAAKPGAPVKKEQAVIDFTVNLPQIVVTKQARIGLETEGAKAAYESARREIEAVTGGKIVGGSLTDRIDGAKAFVRGQVPAGEFQALIEKLKTLGVVKTATVEQIVQGGPESAEPPLLREQGEIILEIATPARLLTEEHGIGKAIRETFARSLAGILWSIEKLFVGIALAGPWILLAILVILIWKRTRRAKAA